MKSTCGARGFTLIELITVIAIIGVLAGIVLATVGTAKTRSSDTAVKAAMKQAYSQSEIYRNEIGGFGSGPDGTVDASDCTTGVFANARFVDIKNNILANAAPVPALTCSTASNGQMWAISVVLRSGTPWCIDASNNFKSATAASGFCF